MKILADGHAAFAARIVFSLSICVNPCAAEPVRLPAGMSVPLELQHHISASYTPTGSPVYFRVAHDVTIDGQTLIAKGTLVKGRMERATERGMVGRSGSMTLEVDSVPAVDGTIVRVDAGLDKQGRSRGAATVGWTIFWGLPGLVTRGVNPYMEKGAELIAAVTGEADIDPANAIPKMPKPELGSPAEVTKHVWDNERANTVKKFDIERKTTFKTVAFTIVLPDGYADHDASMATLKLLEVEGVPVPEETRATSVEKGAAVFNGWAIARYCRDGANLLTFGGSDPDGRRFHATYLMRFKVKKKD
jgi:hypothetical protein